MRRIPCTTSPTTVGAAPMAAPRAASRPAPRAPTNTGVRWEGSTTSMATATWCALARRLRITRRRRSRDDNGPLPVMAGFIPAIHVFGFTRGKDVDVRDKPGHDGDWNRSLGRDQRLLRGFPAPQPVIGQFGEAPPAVHRIVPAEILAASQDVAAERRQGQFAAVVAFVAHTVAMHLFVERPAFETRVRGYRRIRQTIQKFADLPIIENPPRVPLFV